LPAIAGMVVAAVGEVRFRFNNKESSQILELDGDSASLTNLDLWAR
jgi:hypothetical protein